MADILVVDDDQDIAEMSAEVLRWKGHVVRIARNGAEGLARIAEAIPDVILCDVEMPILDGPDMAYRMFLHDVGQEKVPIVLASGVRDFDRVAEQVGTPYLLAKPFSVEKLLDVIAQALAERIAPTPRV